MLINCNQLFESVDSEFQSLQVKKKIVTEIGNPRVRVQYTEFGLAFIRRLTIFLAV